MKSKKENTDYIQHLIRRKDRIRTKHLLAIKKHLDAVKECEDYINKHKELLKTLQQ